MLEKPASDLTLPHFSLAASTGQTLSLDSFLDKIPLVLLFLEDLDSTKDREMVSAFDDRLREFGEQRSQILGVVKKTAREVREFADENDMNVPILADADGQMARDYDALDPGGRAKRQVIIGDKQGRLAGFVNGGSSAADVVDRALETVRALYEADHRL